VAEELQQESKEVMPSIDEIDEILWFLYRQLEIAETFGESRFWLVREITRLEIRKEEITNATL
jgi:hypothetical protein